MHLLAEFNGETLKDILLNIEAIKDQRRRLLKTKEGSKGDTILHYLARYHAKALKEILLSEGLKSHAKSFIEIENRIGFTVMHMLAHYHGNILKELLQSELLRPYIKEELNQKGTSEATIKSTLEKYNRKALEELLNQTESTVFKTSVNKNYKKTTKKKHGDDHSMIDVEKDFFKGLQV